MYQGRNRTPLDCPGIDDEGKKGHGVLVIKRKEKEMKYLEVKYELGTISAGCLEGGEAGWSREKVGEKGGRTSERVLPREVVKKVNTDDV